MTLSHSKLSVLCSVLPSFGPYFESSTRVVMAAITSVISASMQGSLKKMNLVTDRSGIKSPKVLGVYFRHLQYPSKVRITKNSTKILKVVLPEVLLPKLPIPVKVWAVRRRTSPNATEWA